MGRNHVVKLLYFSKAFGIGRHRNRFLNRIASSLICAAKKLCTVFAPNLKPWAALTGGFWFFEEIGMAAQQVAEHVLSYHALRPQEVCSQLVVESLRHAVLNGDVDDYDIYRQ